MAKNRLSSEDLKNLNWMSEIYRRLRFETKAIELYLDLWKNERLTAKGIDTNEEHEINLETGVIRAVAKPEKTPEDGKQKD